MLIINLNKRLRLLKLISIKKPLYFISLTFIYNIIYFLITLIKILNQRLMWKIIYDLNLNPELFFIRYGFNEAIIITDGMKLIAKFGHDYVSSANLYDEKEIKKIFKPKPKNIVIDVGAYLGYYTIRAAKMIGQEGLVIAIEPNPLSYELLKKNLELNKITNVKMINRALYSSEGKIAFVCKSAGASSSYVYDIRKVLENDGKMIFVEALTLDQVINLFGLKHIDWLKIDAEGSEVEILKGANETLKITNNIIIECWFMNYYIIKSILTKFGFKYKNLGIYHSNVFYLYAYKN